MYIVVDGPEATGKTTLVGNLAKRLKNYTGREVVVVREPGQTPLGAYLRDELLHGREKVGPVSLACLFAYDNALTLKEVIEPALKRGAIVVSDRGFPSAVAYQGGGFELGWEKVYGIYEPLRLEPQFTVILLPKTFSDWEKIFAARVPREDQDNIEGQGPEFHGRVYGVYREMVDLGGRKMGEVISPDINASEAGLALSVANEILARSSGAFHIRNFLHWVGSIRPGRKRLGKGVD